MARSKKIIKFRGTSLRDIKDRLHRHGVLTAQEVAARVAPMIESMAHADFDAGRNCYGDVRALGKYGPVTLRRTGRMRASFGFDAVGSTIRSRLLANYAKYMIGRFKILPIGDRTAIPVKWRRAIDDVFHAVVFERDRGAA